MSIKHKPLPAGIVDDPNYAVSKDEYEDEHIFDMDGINISHADLDDLDFASSGHIGFQPSGTYQPLDLTLTALAGLDSTPGFLKQTGADVFIKDTVAYLPLANYIDWRNTSENLVTLGSVTAGEFLTLGNELLDDPLFNTPTAWDVIAGGWSITGGQAIHIEGPTDMTEAVPATIESNTVYQLTIDLASEWGTLTVTIGGVAKSFPWAAGVYTLYYRTATTGEMIIQGVGDCTLNSISLKKMSNMEIGDLSVRGLFDFGIGTGEQLTITGEAGGANFAGVGFDAPICLSIIGGAGGLGSDGSGLGSPLNFITGSSPEPMSGWGNGGDFSVLTGNGQYAGSIDLDTGINGITTYGTRGIIKIGKSGGRVGLGGIITPTALLHIAAGSLLRPPLQLTVGTLSNTIRAGAIEYCDITNKLFFSSNGSTRRALVEGGGVSGRIPYWSGTALSSDTGFIYNGVNQRVGAAGGFEVQDIKVVGVQQTHIADADGTIADITTKFNNLLLKLETHGLLASS
jgi:hypothetical protein